MLISDKKNNFYLGGDYKFQKDTMFRIAAMWSKYG